jgi:hypothetical protein
MLHFFVASACRNVILGDATARAIFHPKHVRDSGRLKTIAEGVKASVADYLYTGYPAYMLDIV